MGTQALQAQTPPWVICEFSAFLRGRGLQPINPDYLASIAFDIMNDRGFCAEHKLHYSDMPPADREQIYQSVAALPIAIYSAA